MKRTIANTTIIPDSFEIETLIENYPPNFKYKKDFFNHLVSLQIIIPSRNRDLISRDGYVPYSSRILEGKRKDYRKYLDYLVEIGVLDENRKFSEGKSRRFRLTKSYLSKKIKEIQYTDRIFIRKLTQENKVDPGTSARYRYLHKWFCDNKLTIDKEAAYNYAYELFEEEVKEDYYGAHMKLYSIIYSIRCIEQGYFWFKRNGYGDKRIHTNLTNLNSKFRKFLKYDGKTLVNIDITNSQPYLSTSITSTYGNILTFAESSEGVDISDIQSYNKLCVEGGIYEYMADALKEKFGDEYFKPGWKWTKTGWKVKETDPRKRAKEVFFEVIYSKNSPPTKEKDLFREHFPYAMRIFEQVKEKDYKKLSKILQNLESNIVLDIACKELKVMHPNVPLYTIHDSIATTEEYMDLVNKYLFRCLDQKIGYFPKLKQEYWN